MDIVNILVDAGLTVSLNTAGDGLLVSPPAAITPELRALIVEHKQVIIDTFWHPERAQRLCSQLVADGIATLAVSGETSPIGSAWHRAADAMDAAVAAQDMSALVAAIAEWETAYRDWAEQVHPPVDAEQAAARVLALTVATGQQAIEATT